MDIQLEKGQRNEASLKVTLQPADYAAGVDKKIKEYARTAAIKGFRPGKVPPAVIKKLYGKGILVDEVNDKLSKAVTDYIREQKLLVVGDPMMDQDKAAAIDWDTQTDFSFDYRVGLASDFDIDLTALPSLPLYEIQATDTEYADTLADLRKRVGQRRELDAVADGALVMGKLEHADHTHETALPTDKMTEAGKALFTGKKVGDVLTLPLETIFTDEKSWKQATGHDHVQGEGTFTIEGITAQQDADVNQDFFDKVLGKDKVDSEEGFRAEVMNIMQENYKREAEFLLRDEAQNLLLDQVKIDLPDAFLKQWLKTSNAGNLSEEEIENDYEKFARDLRWTLIRNKIAETADIKVEDEDINAVAENMIRQQFGIYGDDNGMQDVIKRLAQNYLRENKGQNYMNVFNRVFAGKTMDFVLTRIKTNPQPIGLDEFKQKAAIA